MYSFTPYLGQTENLFHYTILYKWDGLWGAVQGYDTVQAVFCLLHMQRVPLEKNKICKRDLSFHFYDFPRILWRAWKDRHVYEGFQMVQLEPPAFPFQFLGHEGLIKVNDKSWCLNTMAPTNPRGNLFSAPFTYNSPGYSAKENRNARLSNQANLSKPWPHECI